MPPPDPDLVGFTDEQVRDALLGRGIEWDEHSVQLHRLPWMTDEQWASVQRFVRRQISAEFGREPMVVSR